MEKEIKNVQDFVKYLLGEDIKFEGEKQQLQFDNLKKEEKAEIKPCINQPKYIPQKGDIVEVTEDVFKGVRGEIIAEVELYDCYQIKVSELNAIYVPKDGVKVIKKKLNKEERAKRIKELQSKIDELYIKRDAIDSEIKKYYEEKYKLIKEKMNQ